MNNRNLKIYKYGRLILLLFFAFILVAFLCQFFLIKNTNKTEIKVNGMESGPVYVKLKDIAEADTWKSDIPQSTNPDDTIEYTGATCNFEIVNSQKIEVNDWTLRIDITGEYYLNGFWCGEFEVHQFRDGKEIIEVVNSKNYDLQQMKLEHNEYRTDPYIVLRTGDYLIYHPSEKERELLINRESVVSFGAIFYYIDDLDLSSLELTYHNNRHIYDGIFFWIVCGFFVLWVLMEATYFASKLTYVKTKRTVESLSHSIITGLSREYKTLWLIHVKEKTIELIRNLDEANVQQAIVLAKKMEDYDVAMRYYIDHYVDESERQMVWESVALDAIKRKLETESFFSINYLHHFLDDSTSIFQMAFTKVSAGKNEYNIVLAYRDIDQFVKKEQEKERLLEEALQEAERANRTKSMFLASMSHEIRTPINAILGMDTMILRETTEGAIKEYAKNIKSASNTLLSLINDILDFSKIESGEMEIIPNQYQLDSLINDLNNMVRNKIEEKGLTFEMEINPQTPAKLFGDEIRIKQIILNILNNAAKYTKEGKVIWKIDFERLDDEKCLLKVQVEDTGIGIKADDLEMIYSPYRRVDESNNRNIEGTGLGLNITKNLLEKMGSKLKVQSVYGEGSVFSFELEQKMWGNEAIGNHLLEVYDEEESVESFHAKTAEILVVDDVDMNLMVIKNLLKRVEIAPETTMSGNEAIEMANNKHYDIIFLDSMMPELSGEETLIRIRKESTLNRDTPIIVLTANAIIGAKEEYLRAGFTDYLSKPVSGESLENMIYKYLPSEKIDSIDKQGNISNTISENRGITNEIEKIDGVCVSDGIAASGDEEIYLSVCRNFCETAEVRAGMILEYWKNEDISNFAIQAHALKSSARLIGAMELSKQALEMELAGKEKNESRVNEGAQNLVDQYLLISQRLKAVFDDNNRDNYADKADLPENKLRDYLGELLELVEAYDFETAKELFESLNAYKLSEEADKVYKKIKPLMAEVKMDEIAKLLGEFLN